MLYVSASKLFGAYYPVSCVYELYVTSIAFDVETITHTEHVSFIIRTLNFDPIKTSWEIHFAPNWLFGIMATW